MNSGYIQDMDTSILTPSKQFNRHKWNLLSAKEVSSLQEFENLERDLFEREETIAVSEAEEESIDSVPSGTIGYSLSREVEKTKEHEKHETQESVNVEKHALFEQPVPIGREESNSGNSTSAHQNNRLFEESTFMSLPEDVSHIQWVDRIDSPPMSPKMASFYNSCQYQDEKSDSLDTVQESVISREIPREVFIEAKESVQGPSKILNKLFPGLLSNIDTSQVQKKIQKEETEVHVQLKSLKSQVQQLQDKVQTLQVKNSKLEKERKEWNKRESSVSAQRAQFEQYKTLELEKIQKMRENESRLLKREKLLWEKQKKASDILPTKKDRQELENSKKQISDLQDQFKQKEVRLLLSQDRFKRRVDELTKRNLELQEEVKVLEKDRAVFVEKLGSYRALPSVKEAEAQSVDVYCQTDASLVAAVQKAVKTVEEVETQDQRDWLTLPFHVKESVASEAAFNELDDLQDTLGIDPVYQEQVHKDGKYERFYDIGLRLAWYPNGTIKESYDTGKQIIYFSNGDKKQIDPEGTVVYWYTQSGTVHTSFKDGLEIYEFKSGQLEKHYKDGSREILFPDKTVKHIMADGQEISYFSDGRIQRIDAQGIKTLEFPDGTRERYSSDGLKTRLYPDGSMKKVYPDGTQETRWMDGSIRIKDASGRILKQVG